jgi:hypothetical protein
MKTSLTIILTLIISSWAFSQQKDSLNTLADSAIKKFTWDIQKSDKGDLMFLDIPYLRENHTIVEYLSLTVAKSKSRIRPDFISIIIPSNVVQSNGIFIKFANTIISKNGERRIEMEKGDPVSILFERCNSQDCTARIIDGYVLDQDTNTKVDIFQKFLDFDHILFLFIYPDKSHKSVVVPLFTFKEQYKAI